MEAKLKTEKANLKRRSFLLTLGAGSAGAAAVVVVGAGSSAPQALQQAVKAEVAKGPGYAESEHVRNYYRTTRV